MLAYISGFLNQAIETFEDQAADTPAYQIVLATVATYFFINQLPGIARGFRARHTQTYQQRVIDMAYDIAKHFPPVQKYVQAKLDKDLNSTRTKIEQQRSTMSLRDTIPETGRSSAEILTEFGIDASKCSFNFAAVEEGGEARKSIVQSGDGKDSGALYAVHTKEQRELLKEVYDATTLCNTMHDKWPRISAMQAEVIRWCQNLFHGSPEGHGLITHGGSTSIIEAMAAYVIDARARGIQIPEIVVPDTAHAAFKKAADLTGAKLIVVPVDKHTGAVTVKEMSKYLSGRTAVIVGSAPSFMNGIHDPIGELGKLAQQRKVPFHVDACLGGFLTAFLETSDDPMDFRVPGVTSISADMHKFGCCPKGTSICMFSTESPVNSVYAALNWSGGMYTTSGILDGSTSGARVAEIYATLSSIGFQKYSSIARDIIDLRRRIQTRVTGLNTEDIYIFGDPKWSVLGFRSNTLNVHLIADELDKLGWKLNLLQKPDGFHICLTQVHTLVEGFEDKFISDLKTAIAGVKSYPDDKAPEGNVKVYGAISTMPSQVQRLVCLGYQKARLAFNATFFGGEAASKNHDQDPKVITIRQRNNF